MYLEGKGFASMAGKICRYICKYPLHPQFHWLYDVTYLQSVVIFDRKIRKFEYLIISDEPELEFSGSSRAEPSWGTLIFELKPS